MGSAGEKVDSLLECKTLPSFGVEEVQIYELISCSALAIESIVCLLPFVPASRATSAFEQRVKDRFRE